eukprot:gene22367-34247_t
MDDFPTWTQEDPYTEQLEHLYDDEDKEEEKKPQKAEQPTISFTPVDLLTPGEEFIACQVASETIAAIVDRGSSWVLTVMDASYEIKELMTRPRGSRESEVHNFFIDPTGQHILVSLRSGENYYVNTASDDKEKPKLLKHLNGRLGAVAWEKDNKRESATGAILVGDARGMVFLVKLDRKEGCTTLNLVYDIGRQMEKPGITGIAVEPFGLHKLVVLVSTGSRLYEFKGGPTVQDVFTPDMLNAPVGGEKGKASFVKCLPGPCDPQAGIAIYRPSSDLSKGWLVWASVGGFYHAKITWPENAEDSVLSNGVYSVQEAPLASKARGFSVKSHASMRPADTAAAQDKPLAIMLKETSMTVLFSNRLHIIAQPPGLRWRASKDPSSPNEVEDRTKLTEWKYSINQPISITYDHVCQKSYVVSRRELREMEIPVTQGSNTWKVFLYRATSPEEPDRDQYYHAALDMCKTDAEREKVVLAAADYFFSEGKYFRAAKLYARANASLEDTVLRFSQCGEKTALLDYLKKRVDFVKARARHFGQEVSQLTCICTLVCKVYLDLINAADDDAPAREVLRKDFHDFISENVRYVQAKIVFELVYEYGMQDEVLYFADMTRNPSAALGRYITDNNYEAALKCLTTNCVQNPSVIELWYTYSPQIMTKIPKALVDAWMNEAEDVLNPSRLIPAMLRYHPRYNPPGETTHQAIRYLNYLVNSLQCTDENVHNLIIQLYAEHSPTEDELVAFLKDTMDDYYYDEKYALRVCLQHGKTAASALIYATMGMHEEAVNLALKYNDTALAKELASEASVGEEKKKTLWLAVAHRAIQNGLAPGNEAEEGIRT